MNSKLCELETKELLDEGTNALLKLKGLLVKSDERDIAEEMREIFVILDDLRRKLD